MPSVQLTPATQESLMREALHEARLGLEQGEAPIGCVIALAQPDGSARVVARGHNRVNALQRKNAHAEIIAFENAGRRESEPDQPAPLPLAAANAVLVSTLEPCVMCLGAAMEAGVALVLFGLVAPADSGTGRVKPPESPESRPPQIVGHILPQESRALFQEWMQSRSRHARPEQTKFVQQLLDLTR